MSSTSSLHIFDQVTENRYVSFSPQWKDRVHDIAHAYHSFHRESYLAATVADMIIHAGEGVRFAASDAPISPAHRMAQFFTHGHDAPEVNCEILRNFLWEQDPALIGEFQQAFVNVLRELAENPPKNVPYQMIEYSVAYCLSILPFTNPEGLELTVPRWRNGEWVAVPFRNTVKMFLTPSWFSSPLPAYGFVSDDGDSFIAFTATPPFAFEGSVAGILQDATPLCSPGAFSAWYGEDQIVKFLTDHPGTTLVGISLGAAIAHHVYQRYGDKFQISRVQMLNPPGFYPKITLKTVLLALSILALIAPTLWSYMVHDSYNALVAKVSLGTAGILALLPFWINVPAYEGPKNAQIDIYRHEGDVVSSMGYYIEGENVNFYHILTGEHCAAEHPISAHAKCYVAHKHVTFLKTSVEYENESLSRHVTTAAHMILAPPLVFFPTLAVHFIKSVFKLLLLPFSICNP